MDNESSPSLAPQPLPQSNSRRKRSAEISNSSPEFEFWKVRNPSLPQPNLLSADELFSGGILLPTNQIDQVVADPPPHEPYSIEQPISEISISRSGPQEPGPSRDSEEPSTASIMAEAAACAPPTTSKRWKDIFKKSEKKSSSEEKGKGKENKKETKKEKRNGGGSSSGNGGSSAAELNINIWPFSRSRSAGNSASRPKTSASATRKASSAPCSRSNSAGESKSRKSWPSSPGRGGVHLGRSSPVWQARRAGKGGSITSSDAVARKAKKESSGTVRNKLGKDAAAAAVGGGGSRGRVLNLNVPMCIGYRHHLSCRGEEGSATGAGGSNGDCVGHGQNNDDGGGSINVGNLFTIRSLFAKRVY